MTARHNSCTILGSAISLFLTAAAHAQSACSTFDTAGFWAGATADEVLECLESGADPSVEIRDGALDAWLPVGTTGAGQGGETHSDPWKALHLVIAYGKPPDLVRALLDAGADPVATIAPGRDWTALHVAAAADGDPGVFDVLLEHGADPNAVTTGNGWTPMHVLAQWGENPAVGDILLDAGFDPAIRDTRGMTAWDLVQARFTEEERRDFPPGVLAVFGRLALVSPPAGDIPPTPVSLPVRALAVELPEDASTPTGDFLDSIDVRAIFRDPDYRPGAMIRYPGGNTRILRAGEDIGEGWILAGALGNSIYVRRGNVRREVPLRD